MEHDFKAQSNTGEEPKDTTRERIYKAALDEFAEHGIDGARVDRIAEAAAINKAMIYYHYRSKEQLYDSVLTEFYRGIAEQLRARTAAAVSVQDYFHAAIETHHTIFRDHPKFLKIMLRELANPRPELMDTLAKTIIASGMPTATQAKLTGMIQSGELRNLDMRQAMVSFISMSMGYLIMAPIFNRVFSISEQERFLAERPDFIVDLFLHGIKERS